MSDGSITEDPTRHFVLQLAAGLKAAHAKDRVHRDIKPGNILITENYSLKILDFGLAKLAGKVDLPATSSTVGKMAYMSPEQVQNGKVDYRSSWGTTEFRHRCGWSWKTYSKKTPSSGLRLQRS